MANQHSLRILKRVDHNRTSIPESDLENWLAIASPPAFTNCRMVFSKFQQMSGDWESSRDLWDALDPGYVG